MKKMLVISLCFILFLGCDQLYDYVFIEQIGTHSVYYGDFSMIKNEQRIGVYIGQLIAYTDNKNPQSPAETWLSGKGSCTHFAKLYLNILYVNFGIKGEIVVVKGLDARTIEEGGSSDHAMVRVNGVVIEPQSGRIIENAVVRYSYSFDSVLKE